MIDGVSSDSDNWINSSNYLYLIYPIWNIANLVILDKNNFNLSHELEDNRGTRFSRSFFINFAISSYNDRGFDIILILEQNIRCFKENFLSERLFWLVIISHLIIYLLSIFLTSLSFTYTLKTVYFVCKCYFRTIWRLWSKIYMYFEFCFCKWSFWR